MSALDQKTNSEARGGSFEQNRLGASGLGLAWLPEHRRQRVMDSEDHQEGVPPGHGQFARRAAGCEDEGVGAESDPERRQGILVSVHSNAAADIRTLQYPSGPGRGRKSQERRSVIFGPRRRKAGGRKDPGHLRGLLGDSIFAYPVWSCRQV